MPEKLRLLRFFFFNDTATTEIYPLSLHNALPISSTTKPDSTIEVRTWTAEGSTTKASASAAASPSLSAPTACSDQDRKSTRLNSSHANISYAVFCLKKKNKQSNKLPTILRYQLLR